MAYPQSLINLDVDNTFVSGKSICTTTKTIKSGQVLKKWSWMQSDVDGKLIAHTGLSEVNLVTFATITTGQTLILGGLTFTAGSGSVTAVQLADIWADIAAGTTAANATTAIAAKGYDGTTVGTFTSGTFGSWNTTIFGGAVGTATKTLFTSTGGLANVTDIVDSGTATDPVVSKVDGVTTFSAIAGITAFDVDATSADVDAMVYTEATFYGDKLVWSVDPTVDTITKEDGTTVAVTAYHTGATGLTSAATQRLRDKFLEGSEFVVKPAAITTE